LIVFDLEKRQELCPSLAIDSLDPRKSWRQDTALP